MRIEKSESEINFGGESYISVKLDNGDTLFVGFDLVEGEQFEVETSYNEETKVPYGNTYATYENAYNSVDSVRLFLTPSTCTFDTYDFEPINVDQDTLKQAFKFAMEYLEDYIYENYEFRD